MNRAPGSYDRWWNEHQAKCGGTFIKIKEPENFGKKKSQSKKRALPNAGKGQPDIKSFVGKMKKPSANIFGFGGTSYAQPSTSKSGLSTQGKSGAVTVNPGWKVNDNSSKGSVIKKSITTSTKSDDAKTDDDSNVSATVRDIWAKKFAANSGQPMSKENKETSLNTVQCPVCNILVPAENVNSHLDTCLAKSDESMANHDQDFDAHVGANGKPAVSCKICGKTLADPTSLYRHRKIHSGEKPHKCPFCGRRFIQR